MVKRRIYLLLSFLVITGILYLSHLVGVECMIDGGGGAYMMFLPVLLMSGLLLALVSLSIGGFNINRKNDIGVMPLIFPLGIVTLFYKKIYYDGLGNFWCYLDSDNDLHVYEQKWWILEKKLMVSYDSDVEKLREKVKKGLDKRYKTILKEKTKRDNFKNWNGYVDKQSQREGRLKKLLDK